MSRINCYIPITLRITGELSDDQLAQLSDTVARAVGARLASAERAIQAANGGHWLPSAAEVREPYDPARDDPVRDGYDVPSYQNRGAPRSVPLRRPAGTARPWIVRRTFSFPVQVRRLFDFFASLSGAAAAVAEGRIRYLEYLHEVRRATVWLVMAQRPILLDRLVEEVSERYSEFVPPDMKFLYGHTVYEAGRQRLLLLDDGNRLQQLPNLSRNPGAEADGRVLLYRGGMLLFVAMALPRVELPQTAVRGMPIEVRLRLRDLGFIVNGESFNRLFYVPWENYLQEFGDETAPLHIESVYPVRRVPFETLKLLMEDTVARQVAPESAYFGNLYLLNQHTLDGLPPAARGHASRLTTDMTRGLGEARQFGTWEPGWVGAYIYVVLSPTADQLSAAHYRPEARRLTPRLLLLLQGDPEDRDWQQGLLNFLINTFGSRPTETRPAGGSVFEFVLAELESLDAFNTLFDKTERAGRTALHQQLIRLTLATRYATHTRAQRSHELLKRRVLSRRRNVYRAQEQELWLDRDANARVRVDQVLGEVDSIYIFERDEQRLKPSRIPAFREALQTEREVLIGRILRGEDTTQYTEESFTQAAIGAAAQRIHLSDDDFEEVTIQRSMRLKRLEPRLEAALPIHYVTFEFVERVRGETWQSVSRLITESDDDFEARLIYWRLRRAGEFWEAAGLTVTIVGLIAIAWGAGIIAALIQAAGGATAVLISIGISELLFILRVVFGDAKLTLRGFLEAALDGYLMALGFRGAGIFGRAAAQIIGTQTLRRIVGGWLAERLIVGVVGGAGTAALTTFSHDIINIATGQGGWSGIGTYVRNMAWGALLGTVFEFGVGALQPILRAGGENALQTLSQVVERVRGEGFTAARWTALTTEALGNLRARLNAAIGDVAARGFAGAMGERLTQVAEQLGAEYRLAVFRRVLELSPEALTREAVGGLEKFLSASRTDLTNEAALAILNRLNPAQLRNFLETLTTLDDPLLATLSRTGQLDALATVPQVIRGIRSDPVIVNMLLEAARLSEAEAVARARAIMGFARSAPAVPETIQRGEFFARGGTSSLYEVVGRPDLLVKVGGGRLPREAQSMIELEMMGIETVYAATRRIEGQTHIVLRRLDGVGSKDIIGRVSQPLRTPQHLEVITQRTVDDLERIYRTLAENKVNVPDFQFIVRRSDGAVFVNDPANWLTRGTGPSGTIRNIIDRFRRILRDKQAAEGGGGGAD